jgi:hypothetical protein
LVLPHSKGGNKKYYASSQKYKTPYSDKETKEIAILEKSLSELRFESYPISPIILPLSSQASFKHLTSNPKRVGFDLAGDGIKIGGVLSNLKG